MCCGTAKSPCIEIVLHPDLAENCCGTAKSPCIEVELHPDVKENSSDSDSSSEDEQMSENVLLANKGRIIRLHTFL